jgi:RNA polymerase sigma-70 factor (ECF subfamily)
MEPSVQTVQLRRWLERMRQGDRAAEDELLRSVGGRLEVLAHRMLARCGRLRRLEQTGDVLQNATLRLLRSLRQAPPESMRGFFGLAAMEIRRELIDLARHHFGRGGDRLPIVTCRSDVAEPADDDRDIDLWGDLHEAVEALPARERELVSLAFYHGLSKGEIAELFEVDVRTIRRWWQEACMNLRQRLAGRLPGE